MTPSPTRRLLVLVVAAAVLASPALAPVAAAPDGSATATAAVSVDPGTTNTTVGGTTTVDVVVDAPDGVSAYQFNASLPNGSVADITDVTLGGSPTFPETSYGPDNDTVTVGGGGASFDSTTPTVATLELSGDVAGETSIDLTDVTVQNESGDDYDIGTVDGGSLTVESPDSTVTVTGLADLGSVEQGSTASVSATVENTGDAATDATVSFAVDGSETDARTVSLAVDESRTLTFDVDTASLSTGSHSYTLTTTDDSATRSFEVTDPPEAVTVDLRPTDASVASGGSATFDVVATAANGIQGASVSVGLTDATTAQITGASPNGDAAFPDASVGADNETAGLEIGYLSDQDASDGLTVGTVTLTGEAAGETTLDVTGATLTNESSEYTIDQFGSAQLTVTDEQPQATVGIEPSNASVAAGSNATYEVVSTADGPVTDLSLSVSLTNNTTASVADIAPGEGATTESTAIGADNGSASLAASYADGADATEGLVLATVTLSGVAAGETNLTVAGATLTDGTVEYEVATGGEGRLVVTEPSPVVTGGNPAADLDDDGRYEDVDGNGVADLFDALTYYNERDSDAIRNNPS
ncbi:CARDB domain-containing protein, partial [Halapricum sp. CBA1109]|uniref:CARDB domain-containing protein n=1 Tax=Halapricum sp. CBA1109 TaxID=2668068 RepID=UPI0018D2340C